MPFFVIFFILTFKKVLYKQSKKISLIRQQKSWSQQDVTKKLGISIPVF